MISEASASECFVYVTLPGQAEAVTAGRFVLAKDRRGNAGADDRDTESIKAFVYEGFSR